MTLDMESMTRAEQQDTLLECLDRSSKLIARTLTPIRSKPVLGGVFGAGGFCLCSVHEVLNGLDSVAYFVSHEKTGYVFGFASTRGEALDFARDVLQHVEQVTVHLRMQAFKEWFDAERSIRLRAHEEEMQRRRDAIQSAAPSVVKSIGRRRQRIFDEAGGKCHYCAAVLSLHGKWHVEHKMPKALGGGNEPGNLVASCVSCNHKKIDTTDVEFKAKLAREQKA